MEYAVEKAHEKHQVARQNFLLDPTDLTEQEYNAAHTRFMGELRKISNRAHECWPLLSRAEASEWYDPSPARMPTTRSMMQDSSRILNPGM
jgi:hypothetical protein